MVIGIIGGGASGMMAALAASQNKDCRVILFERQARLGRKLLATGNGRCNLTNQNLDLSHYHGEEPEFAASSLAALNLERTLSLFRNLGLYTVTEPSGRVYPYSDQANSVLDVLRFGLQRGNITVLTGTEIKKVKRTAEGFLVASADESYACDRLIVASGGIAGTKLGGTMSGYQLLRSFGHKTTKLRPALVQVKSNWNGCVSLKGVRANCRASIYHNGKLHAQSAGELQFTDYGLSGPVIFEISRDVCSGGNWCCKLDFLPDVSQEQLKSELLRRRCASWAVDDLLTGILHNRLGRVLTATVGIHGQMSAAELNDADISEVCRVVKELELPLTETLGMDAAQVTAGGAVTTEFDPRTMESCLVPGLYACGEVLDVDGDCGGYNLQWAWSSGWVAGCNAGEVSV